MTYIDSLPELKVERALEHARSRRFTAAGGGDMLALAGGDERYALWLLIADTKSVRTIGLSILDLSDWTWADAYADGTSPTEALREALANDDTFGGAFA